MKRVLFFLSLIFTLTTQAQIYWDGTADKNFPGEGTEMSPYLISTPEQLAGLAARVNDDGETFEGKFLKPSVRKLQRNPSVAILMVMDIPFTTFIMARGMTGVMTSTQTISIYQDGGAV